MAIQKKHGKGRLDKWYKLAKEKGYRARAAFKLIQLNQKFHFLENTKVLIDLCAAPGSWCQVAAQVMPAGSHIVGVDLAPIKPIARCLTFQSDITSDKCRATLRQHLKTWKADTVLHDGAPNVGTAWVQDAYTQAELVLQSMKLATEFLVQGGTFVTKIFRSKDYNSLLWVFNQLFTKVEATKPPSSRNVSAEIFVVCRGYKAPKKLDAKFLDPKFVFADLAAPTPNNEAKVFNPEKKKRKREGYEEGDWTQFKTAPATDFISTTDPIAMLATFNRFTFLQQGNADDLALTTLDQLPDTTSEIRACCSDLKLLGRKDFRILLKWRLKVRDIFALSDKQAVSVPQQIEVAQVEPLDQELQDQADLQRMRDQRSKKHKKERRQENERKQKEIVRMQMNMTTPMELGLEQSGPQGEDSLFDLKPIDRAHAVDKLAHGRMHVISNQHQSETNLPQYLHIDSDSDEDGLEGQLDSMYNQYQERKQAQDAKYRAKKARMEESDDEWTGCSPAASESGVSDDELIEEEENDDDNSIASGSHVTGTLLTSLATDVPMNSNLTNRAALFFDQDLFKSISGAEVEDSDDSGMSDDLEHSEDSGVDMQEPASQSKPSVQTWQSTRAAAKTSLACRDSDVETASSSDMEHEEHPSQLDVQDSEPMKSGCLDIDIITAEAMTLAHEIATGKKSKSDLTDDNFNRFTFRDTNGLPDWFLDDENQHSRMQKPITKEAAAAIKEKARALNARPIKKILEAKGRKKFRAARRLEKMRKKSALVLEDDALSEADKARAVAKMMARASRKQPQRSIKLVVARGSNRGISGRPKGTKGRYKMVDKRLKKDMRAAKRISKKKSR